MAPRFPLSLILSSTAWATSSARASVGIARFCWKSSLFAYQAWLGGVDGRAVDGVAVLVSADDVGSVDG